MAPVTSNLLNVYCLIAYVGYLKVNINVCIASRQPTAQQIALLAPYLCAIRKAWLTFQC